MLRWGSTLTGTAVGKLRKRTPSIGMGRGRKRSAGYCLFRLSTIRAARLLLSVESMDRVAACGIGQPDRPLIFLHSYCAGLLRAAAQGSAFRLDFLDVRSVHTGMRHDAPDGSLDH